jgi:hypothetical protein
VEGVLTFIDVIVFHVQGESGGGFPDIQEDFTTVVESFNRQDAANQGITVLFVVFHFI